MQADERRTPLWKFLVLIAILGGAGYFAYTKFAKHDAPAAQQMPPAAVTAQEVKAEDLPLTFEYSGRTAGSRQIEIRARVSGILKKRTYVEGQAVKEGDVLFEIDPAPFVAEQDQAKAGFTQANADWKRAQELYKAKALSERERDQAQANYAQTKAQMETASINLAYTTVMAPFSGVSSREGLSEGSLVTADTTLLTRLTQLDPMYVNFSAPDAEVLTQRQQVAEGKLVMPESGKLQAEIHFGDGSVYSQTGDIDFTDTLIDPETGTVSGRAVVPNAAGVIMPGQFVRVVVKGFVRKAALTIPDNAVMQGPQGTFVYIVDANGKAQIRPVTLGDLVGDKRIIESGIAAGDMVISEGMIKVRPDSPVQVATPEAAAPAVATPAVDDAKKADEAQPEAAAAATAPAATEPGKDEAAPAEAAAPAADTAAPSDTAPSETPADKKE